MCVYICLNMKICTSLCFFFKPSTFLQRCSGRVMNREVFRNVTRDRRPRNSMCWLESVELSKRRRTPGHRNNGIPFSPTFEGNKSDLYVSPTFPHNKMDMSSLDIYLLSQVGGLSVCQTRQLALKIWTCVGFKCVCVCVFVKAVCYFLFALQKLWNPTCFRHWTFTCVNVVIDGRLVCPSPLRAGMDACVNWINPG